eukprot:3074139-Rhodomonas_salina.1
MVTFWTPCVAMKPRAVEEPAINCPAMSEVPSSIPTTPRSQLSPNVTSVPTKHPVAPPIATDSPASALRFWYVGSSTPPMNGEYTVLNMRSPPKNASAHAAPTPVTDWLNDSPSSWSAFSVGCQVKPEQNAADPSRKPVSA